MYEECITCEKLGAKCDGPNFMLMSTMDIVDWIDRYQHIHHITNSELAEMSAVPKGTIDGIKARKRTDIRHETLRPILRALMGGDKLGDPCPGTDEKTAAGLEVENKSLKHELQLAEKLIDHQEREIERCAQGLKERTVAICVLLANFAIMFVCLITYFMLDMGNLDAGLVRETHISPMVFFIGFAIVSAIVAAPVVIMLLIKNKKKKVEKFDSI